MLVTTLLLSPCLPVDNEVALGTRERDITRRNLCTEAAGYVAQMNGRNLLRILESKVTGRVRAPISAGADKSRVPQDIVHQLMDEIGRAPYAHPGLVGHS